METFPSEPNPSYSKRELAERRMADVANRQHGAISRDQIREAGITESQIEGFLRRKRLHDIAQGIYAVGHPKLNRRGRVNSVLLRVGPENGAVSHISAARSWDMVAAGRDGDLHVSVRDRRKLIVPAGIALHRPRALGTDEIVLRYQLPTTTPERTLRDLLASSSVVEITRMLERMVTVLGRSPDDLHAWGKALPRVSGKSKLIEALDHVVGPAVLRSELETQFRSLCQTARLPLAATNVRVGRWEVDALWEHLRLAVELDSYRFHGGRWQFDRDREKGLELAALGYELVRLTWPQVKHQQRVVGPQLARVLERRARECR